MKADYAAGAETKQLLDPDADVWHDTARHSLALSGTPIGLQPTQLIRSTWMEKKIGAVEQVSVCAMHDGHILALRLEWDDPVEDRDHGDNTSFLDAAALAFPVLDDAPLVTMGEPGVPINAWYWRADGVCRQLSGEGVGTSEIVDSERVGGAGVWRDGRWHVCIGRALAHESTRSVVQLAPGRATKFGIAIWEGSRGERGGIKAYSGPNWTDLVLAEMEEA